MWIGGPVGTAVHGRIIHSKFENPKSMVISKYRSGPWQLLPRNIRGSTGGPGFSLYATGRRRAVDQKTVAPRELFSRRDARAKIINAEGESLAAALGEAPDIMMAHPLAFPPA